MTLKAVFHVGMGKTGTSSIQAALDQSTPLLEQSKTRYLGMWPTFIDESLVGPPGLSKLLAASVEDKKAHGESFVRYCSEEHAKSGAEQFVFSNESLFTNGENLQPFLDVVKEHMDVKVIAYMREPISWLSSAYTQWGIRHKKHRGPILTFADLCGSDLVHNYSQIHFWHGHYRELFTLRSYDEVDDVVEDFGALIGVPDIKVDHRVLERAEPAEILLRALYNDRLMPTVHPSRFDKHVYNTHRYKPRNIQDMADMIFDHSAAGEIVEQNLEMFSFIDKEYGLNLSGNTKSKKSRNVDSGELKERVLDYLLSIVMEQADKIAGLESRIDEIENK